MSPEQVHGYLTAGRTLSPTADWAVTQVAVYGPGVLLVGALLGLWCALTAIRHAAGRLRELLADRPLHASAIEGLEQLEAELAATWERLQNETREGEK